MHRRQLQLLEADQARLRANLASTPSTAAVYKKYLKKLDDQETAIEKLQQEVRDLQTSQEKQRKDLEDYLNGLNVG